ncbi:hypothetical protein ACBY01_15650 [Sphingomonas sp. ac-8]|uniref:hypothetical protein n=1 Tax=Sphingomonas sp. ac-8 TaxID=3242977 RepID=UPI003A7FC7AD
MDAQHIQRIEQSIVRAVVGNVSDVMDGDWEDRHWAHLFVDIEIAQDGERDSSTTFALAHKPGQPLEKVSFRLPREAKRLFGELAEAMRRPGDDRWSSAQLRVERDGSYALEFSYDPPWRLSGNLIDKRFKDYLDRWLATPEGRQFAQEACTPRGGGWDKLVRLLRSVSKT